VLPDKRQTKKKRTCVANIGRPLVLRGGRRNPDGEIGSRHSSQLVCAISPATCFSGSFLITNEPTGYTRHMDIVPLEDALLLLDKWKTEGTSVAVYSRNRQFMAVLRNLRVEKFSPESAILVCTGCHFRLNFSDAEFTYLDSLEVENLEDYPGELTSFAFEECLRILFPNDGRLMLLSEIRVRPDP
jgi:hypothetical protein